MDNVIALTPFTWFCLGSALLLIGMLIGAALMLWRDE